MNLKTRLVKLEKRFPKPAEPPFPDFRVFGNSRSEMQIEMIRRLRLYADDQRATTEQREHWLAMAESIEPALKWELESEERYRCPQCHETNNYETLGSRGLQKCLACGCLFQTHRDGPATVVRPGANSDGEPT